MADIIRLKEYRTFMYDGRSSVTYRSEDKRRVMVAVIVGSEPLKISTDLDFVDVDEIILRMADRIRSERKAAKRKKVPRG